LDLGNTASNKRSRVYSRFTNVLTFIYSGAHFHVSLNFPDVYYIDAEASTPLTGEKLWGKVKKIANMVAGNFSGGELLVQTPRNVGNLLQ